MSKAELFRKLQELAFAKTELELFLDTHPDCRASLDYYHRIVDEYNMALEEYEGKYGPITAAANQGETWNWIKSPWPWHVEANGGTGADSIDGRSTDSYMNGNMNGTDGHTHGNMNGARSNMNGTGGCMKGRK